MSTFITGFIRLSDFLQNYCSVSILYCKGEKLLNYIKENTIATERLIIRPVAGSDTEDIHKYAGDKEINMMLFLPNDTVEQTVEFVRNAVREWANEEPSIREYVMLYNDRIIGGIDLETLDESTYEIGWVVSKEYRNNGFVTEAGNALIGYAFDVLSAKKVIAHCDIRNSASEKVMKKLGMKLTDNSGTRFYERTGVTSGELTYSIDKSDYEGNE